MRRLLTRHLWKWLYLIFLGIVMYNLGFLLARTEIQRRENSSTPEIMKN